MAINDFLNRLYSKKDPTAVEEFISDQQQPVMLPDTFSERPTEEAAAERSDRNVARLLNEPFAGENYPQEDIDRATEESRRMAERAEAESAASKPVIAEVEKPKEASLLDELKKIRQGSDDELKSAKTMDAIGNLLNVISPMIENRQRARAIRSAQSLGADPGSLNMPKISTDTASRVLAQRQAKINELIQEQNLMAALQPKKMSALDAAKIKESESKAKMYEAKAEQAGKQPASIFEKKKMEKLAAAGVDYITKDRDQYLNNINKIDNAIDILKTDKVTTSGRVVGRLPDVFRTESSIAARENIQSAVQETLRPTLGAQFTEKEGERIMNLQYNEKLDEAENMKRAQELKKFIEKKVKFSDDLYSYIEEKGSDRGFPYAKYGMKKADETDQGIQKDSTIEQYAKQNNINYKDAERILKSRGYNAK